MWQKELHTIGEGDVVYIEFNIGHRDMVGKEEGGDIGVQ